MKFYSFTSLLQREDWLTPAYVGVDQEGLIQYLSNQPHPDGSAIEAIQGIALPGFQNAHSHAFQYAMAGLAENHPGGVHDDFWTWREEMYKCALSIDPDQAEAVAAMVYAEMVRHGYTHVAEFHYLHHDKNGKPYQNISEMGERMISAAKTAGIKITLIPVFYQKGGFGKEPEDRQKRFISKTIDDYFRLFEASADIVKKNKNTSLGFSVHSLRAVDLKDVVKTFEQGPKNIPFHLHASEQLKEVEDCLAHIKKRPVQWILENLPLNERFNLVHATHLDDNELRGLVKAKANVVLCPSTEGNLGDGIFRMKEFAAMGGRWCLGTDSHIGINPLDEFRMMDYRQRLITHQRNTFSGDGAKYMVNEEIATGRSAMGLALTDHFALGQPLDAVVYSAQSHLLSSTSGANRLATILYTTDSSKNLGTMVNGKWIVRNQHHIAGKKLKSDFAKAIKELKNR